MKNLNSLFDKFHSDKGTMWGDKHHYGSVFEIIFEAFKDQEINVLEIGAFKGGSIEVWLKYFSKAKVISVEKDNHKELEKFTKHKRAKVYIGDANQKDLVEEDSFSIIIDDGDHDLESQYNFLRLYFDKLLPGGLYIIEDLFVGELPWGGEASPKKALSYYKYNSYSNAEDRNYLPKHPQDISFLNRNNLPFDIDHILERNHSFFSTSAIGPKGGLHMMLVIKKA